MRDPQRLNDFYSKLKAIHQTQCPDWRFGQLIVNVFGGRDPFYLEEEDFLKCVADYFKVQM